MGSLWWVFFSKRLAWELAVGVYLSRTWGSWLSTSPLLRASSFGWQGRLPSDSHWLSLTFRLTLNHVLLVLSSSSTPCIASRLGFHYCFQQESNWFQQLGKTFWTELLYEKNFPLPGFSVSSSKQQKLRSSHHG